MRAVVLTALICLSACTWFGSKRQPLPDPAELIVTGAPLGSTLYIDGVQTGAAATSAAATRVVRVAPGPHTVEVRVGEPVVYREDTDVARGEKRVVTVLSGSNR